MRWGTTGDRGTSNHGKQEDTLYKIFHLVPYSPNIVFGYGLRSSEIGAPVTVVYFMFSTTLRFDGALV